MFCALAEEAIGVIRPLEEYFCKPYLLPKGDSARWFVLDCIRQFVRDGKADPFKPRVINRFLRSLSSEHQLTLLTDMVEKWGALGGSGDVRPFAQGHRGMSGVSKATLTDRATFTRIMRALRMVTVPLPHLAGLAAAVRINLDDRLPTMGIFASGRLVANPAFTARLSNDDLVFVLAHELLHLALRTHDRARGSGRLEFDYAHDYIINDMLGMRSKSRQSLRVVSTCPAPARNRPRKSSCRCAGPATWRSRGPDLGRRGYDPRAGAQCRSAGHFRRHGRRTRCATRARVVPGR